MKPIYQHFLYFLGCLFIFSSCHKEVYESGALERDYFIQNIPDGFNWSTLSSIHLEVTPNDQYSGQYLYTIEVFDKNPLLEQTATLYTTGWCTGVKPLKKTISIPAVQSLVYVRQTTPGGRRTIKEIEVVNQSIVCNFLPEENPIVKSISTSSKNQDIPDKLPDNYSEIDYSKSEITLKKNTNYVIKKDYKGKIQFAAEGKCNLYVKAIWTNTAEEWSPTIIQNTSNLYLLEGGQIRTENNKCKFQFSNDATVGIHKDAQLGEEGKNNIILQFQTKGYLVNEGRLYCDQISAESKDMEITNKGRFYANYLKSGDAYSFYNECYANIKTVEMPKSSKLEIAPACAFVSEKMTLSNASIKLESGAMLDVDYLYTIDNGGQNVISGTGNRYALARIKELACQWSQRATVIFNANVYVSCTRYPSNTDLFKINTWEDIASGQTIQIVPSECSQGNDYIPEEPEMPEFPRWIVYNKPYSFASEDNYPSPGDYDMNDLVVSIDSIAHYYEKNDDDDAISKIKLYLTLHAVGGTQRLGAAIQLDELDEDEVKSVSYSQNLPLSNFQTNNRGVEKNQKHAVIPLFDNAHQALGINNTSTIVNTISNTPKWIANVDPCSFEVTIEFTSPVDEEDVEIDELNYFIIVGSRTENRIEIHLPDKDHTNLSITPEKEQKIDEKFMWTIRIPEIFRYPHEWESIKNAYPHFEEWVQSGGDKYKNWYTLPNEELLYVR